MPPSAFLIGRLTRYICSPPERLRVDCRNLSLRSSLPENLAETHQGRRGPKSSHVVDVETRHPVERGEPHRERGPCPEAVRGVCTYRYSVQHLYFRSAGLALTLLPLLAASNFTAHGAVQSPRTCEARCLTYILPENPNFPLVKCVIPRLLRRHAGILGPISRAN